MGGEGTVGCWIVTIGDELINGQRVDTNTNWLAGRLAEIGIGVSRAVSVGDDESAIRVVLSEALEEADVVILSGGLGPTQDDRTKQALASHFEVGMYRDAAMDEAVRGFFEERGREASQVNLDQALVPEGFECRTNRRGTAPGLLKRIAGKLLFAVPGVPGEMKGLYEDWIGPLLNEAYQGRWYVERRWYRTTGIGESDLFNMIGGLEEMAPAVTISYLPSPYGTGVYLTGQGRSRGDVSEALDEAERRILAESGDYLYAVGDLSLHEHVAELLSSAGETLATAESCTGGLIAHTLTNVAGASEWFLRGWVVYSNRAKEEELGVPAELIERHGAVSEEVAAAMAEGALERAGSDWAVGVTGIAGPGGGTEEKPVGLTYIACAGGGETVVRRYMLGKTGRLYIKQRSLANALDLLRRRVRGLDPSRGGWETPR